MVAFVDGKQISGKVNGRFTKGNAAIMGKKGGQVCSPTLDEACRGYLDQYLSQKISEGDERPRLWIMIEAAFKEWLNGNYRPMAFLVERGYGKSPEVFKIETVSQYEIGRDKLKKLTKVEVKTLIDLLEKMDK